MTLPKNSYPLYELTIPSSGKKIKYRAFLVREEKILLLAQESEEPNEVTDAILQIINNCVETKINIDDLSTFDVEYIFLNIRAKSVGEILEFTVVCPDDGETEVDVEINIEEVKVEKNPKHTNKIDLGNGYGVIMKYPTMRYVLENSKKLTDKSTDNVFELIVDCVEQIYNAEEVWESANCSRNDIVEYIDTLTSKQYEKLKEFFDTMPKLKHTVNVTNPKTGIVSPITIEGLPNFFA